MYDDASKLTHEAMDSAIRSVSAMTKGMQQVATETQDFAKRSYEQQTEMVEKLISAKSLDKSIEVQSEFAKTAYQNWVSQATRMGEIYADIAKETYKPFEKTAMDAANAGTKTARQTARKAEAATASQSKAA